MKDPKKAAEAKEILEGLESVAKGEKKIGEMKVGTCSYDIIVKGNVEGEHEVEIIGTFCETAEHAKEATKVIDAIFTGKRMVYTPPSSFAKPTAEKE